MPPDPASVFACRAAAPRPPAPPRPVELGEEQRAALVRAADMAGDRTLLPVLESAVRAYLDEKALAGKAPARRGALHGLLRDRARALDAARRLLRPGDGWQARELGTVAAGVEPDVEAADWALAELARRARVAAMAVDPDDRRRPERREGTPMWRLGWTVAEVWSGSGGYVGRGPDSRFHGFAAECFGAAGEVAAERFLNELAERWQAGAGGLTVGREKDALASFNA